MRCARCHWPTSIWSRDLASGLCGKCQKVDATCPGIGPQAAILQAVYSHAAELMSRGTSAADVEKKMLETGLDPQSAAAIARDLQAQIAVNGGGQPESRGGQYLAVALGILLVMAGGFFLIGNRTGIFPTVP